METSKNPIRHQSKQQPHTPQQADNNNGTLGQEGGLPNRPTQRPFQHKSDPNDIETGNNEYDRHHKEDRANVIKPVSADDGDAEIDPNLPGNRPHNKMTRHSENTGGDSAE